MTVKTARQILRCFRPSGEDEEERAVRAARQVAAKSGELEAEFLNQLAFDRVAATQLDVMIPADTAAVLADYAEKFAARKTGFRVSFRDPAMMAVGASFLVLICLLVWIFLGNAGGFAGMREVEELAKTGDEAAVQQFDPLAAKAGTLGDWFMLEGFDGFAVPPGFEDLDVVGVRLLPYENQLVAVAAVPIGERRAFFYVFEAHPFGVSVKPEGSWQVREYGASGGRALAVRQMGAKCFMVAFDGPTGELEAFLKGREG